MTQTKVVTRFAPSPTGDLHIGGARTALFNYYFAKANGGEFLLRVEDTDKKRSTDDAKKAILDGMEWLGLSHDGEIVYQSENESDHREAAETLLETGHAFRCYLTPEEQDAERQKSRDEGRAFRSPYRDGKTAPSADASSVVRFRVPDGSTTINDEILGEITWQNKDFDDLILLRADGSPVYMLAVVVDDHYMGVSHVVRGDDHLTNAGRQQQIYVALGWEVPVFAHVPLIFGPDGKKLSKRHGALDVMSYAGMGYIPAGMRNYLTRLGWGRGDMEVFTDAQIIKVFKLSDINKSPARLDFDKMDHINGEHLQSVLPKDALALSVPFIEKHIGEALNDAQSARLANSISILLPRAKTLAEIAVQAEFVTKKRPLKITGKAKKPLKSDAKTRLSDLHSVLGKVKDGDWNAGNILDQLNTYIGEQGIGFGKIGPALRACLTGGSPSPDLAVVVAVLGKDEALGRIEDCLNTYFD